MIQFSRFNAGYQASNPTEKVYLDTGANSPTSILRVNNADVADEETWRRPTEQNRRRLVWRVESPSPKPGVSPSLQILPVSIESSL